jgi:Glycosyl transferase family 2
LLDHYRTYLSPIEDAPEGLLAHFLTHGITKGFKPNPLFDPLWYSFRHMGGSTEDPLAALRHFVVRGDVEGFASCPAFSGARYLRRHKDVAEARLPALAHYLTRGKAEGRVCLSPQEDTAQLGTLIKGRSEPAAAVDPAASVAPYRTLRRRIDIARQEVQDAVSAEKPKLVRFAGLKGKLSKLALPRTRNPKISILVPVFNEIAYTVECLAAIVASRPKASFEVVVADDASTDPPIELLSKIRNLRIVRQEANVGFLANCNKAWRTCKGDFLLLLNNDVQLMPGCLDALLDVLERNPDAGAAGPKILYPDGRLQEAGCTLDRDGISTMVGPIQIGRNSITSGTCTTARAPRSQTAASVFSKRHRSQHA